MRISSWRVRSVHASVPDPMLRVRISSWCICSACFKGTALCARLSTWCVCSVHAPVPDSYAQCTHQFLTRTLSMRVSSWPVCSACAERLEHACKEFKILIIFKVPKITKILTNRFWHLQMVSKASWKKYFFSQTQKESLLKIRLRICVRNFAAPNEPLNII